MRTHAHSYTHTHAHTHTHTHTLSLFHQPFLNRSHYKSKSVLLSCKIFKTLDNRTSFLRTWDVYVFGESDPTTHMCDSECIIIVIVYCYQTQKTKLKNVQNAMPRSGEVDHDEAKVFKMEFWFDSIHFDFFNKRTDRQTDKQT